MNFYKREILKPCFGERRKLIYYFFIRKTIFYLREQLRDIPGGFETKVHDVASRESRLDLPEQHVK
jgi:hypothetical protein